MIISLPLAVGAGVNTSRRHTVPNFSHDVPHECSKSKSRFSDPERTQHSSASARASPRSRPGPDRNEAPLQCHLFNDILQRPVGMCEDVTLTFEHSGKDPSRHAPPDLGEGRSSRSDSMSRSANRRWFAWRDGPPAFPKVHHGLYIRLPSRRQFNHNNGLRHLG